MKLLSFSETFPPTIQWLSKTPILFPLQNLILFGVGIPIFLLFLIGVYKIIVTKKPIFYLVLFFITTFFVYQGIQRVTTMRYFLNIYPFIAIFSAIGLTAITKKIRTAYTAIFLTIILIWTLFFMSIYTKPNTRLAASAWIYSNISEDNIILAEHWDDALPISVNGQYKNYNVIQLPVYDQDTDEKWVKMNTLLSQGDYIILSSNRAWGSLMSVPERYPRMAKFYQDLFDEKLEYKKIKEFTSYPSLSYLGIPVSLDDTFAEENFTVFDHPKVIIFQKEQKADPIGNF